MMKLSVENINRTSPYPVEAIDELSVSFVTDNGVCYDVGFYADTFLSFYEGAYHFYISNANHQHAPNDPKILQTVTAVIEEFFRNNPLYCNNRSNFRAR